MKGAPQNPMRGVPLERKLAARQRDGFQVSPQRLRGRGNREHVDVARARKGVGDVRAFTVGPAEGNLQPHAGERREDVHEDDGRVQREAAQRLESGLHGELGRGEELHHGVPLAEGAVLGEVAPGLPHQPDRRVRHRFAAACLQEHGGVRGDARGPAHQRGACHRTRPTKKGPSRER